MSAGRLKYYDITALKEREIQALKLYLMGYSHRRIAEMLGISYGRASQCICTAREKLEAYNFSELAEKAVELGIISPDEIEGYTS